MPRRARESLGGDVENREGLMTTLRQLEVSDVLRGSLRVDEHGAAVMNVSVGRLVRRSALREVLSPATTSRDVGR